MWGTDRNRKGFTLIELLVVVIIVAVLASVGIPLLTGNVQRAIASEAEAGLGTIRTAMRAEVAENNGVLPAIASTPDAAGIGFTPTDLDGRYFVTAAYAVAALGGDANFCIDVNGGSAANTAPRAAQATTIARSMDQDGNIYDATDCGGTILN